MHADPRGGDADMPPWLVPDETALDVVKRHRKTPLHTGIPMLDERNGGLGVAPQEIVEIVGGPGSGKTRVLLQTIVSTVLPRSLGGNGMSVIVLDAEQKLPWEELGKMIASEAMAREIRIGLRRRTHQPLDEDPILPLGMASLLDKDPHAIAGLSEVLRSERPSMEDMHHILRRLLDTFAEPELSAWDAKVERLVEVCMSRVLLLPASSPEELELSLNEGARRLLGSTGPRAWGGADGQPGPRKTPPAVRAILIDSLAPIFWQLRAFSGGYEQAFFSRLASNLRVLLDRFSVSVFCVRPLLFASSLKKQYRERRGEAVEDFAFPPAWRRLVTTRLHLMFERGLRTVGPASGAPRVRVTLVCAEQAEEGTARQQDSFSRQECVCRMLPEGLIAEEATRGVSAPHPSPGMGELLGEDGGRGRDRRALLMA